MRPREEAWVPRSDSSAFLCSTSVRPLRRKGEMVLGEYEWIDGRVESEGALFDLPAKVTFLSCLTFFLFFSFVDVLPPSALVGGRVLAVVLSPVDVDDFLLLAPTTTLPNTSLFPSPSSSSSSWLPGIVLIASRFALAFFLGGEHAPFFVPHVCRTSRAPERFFFSATRAFACATEPATTLSAVEMRRGWYEMGRSGEGDLALRRLRRRRSPSSAIRARLALRKDEEEGTHCARWLSPARARPCESSRTGEAFISGRARGKKEDDVPLGAPPS